MKKLLAFLLIFSVLISILSFSAAEGKPETFTSGSWKYTVQKDGTAVIVRHSGSDAELVIPDRLDGKAVTGIGDQAFWYSESLKTVTIPDSVTSIGVRAFSTCSSLVTVTIPDSVLSIGDQAFWYCESLTNVTIPGSVTSIGDEAFAGCSALTSITIPDSVTSVGVNPFYGCAGLSEIRVSPDHPYLTTIDGVLFSKPDKRLVCYPFALTAETYQVPQDILNIGNNAFFLCTSLTTVIVSDSVTSIGYRAFCECSSLTSVTIPDSVTSIGGMAFSGCESLITMSIPDSVTSIGEDAFMNCYSLTMTVSRDSYAMQYCEEHGITFSCSDDSE